MKKRVFIIYVIVVIFVIGFIGAYVFSPKGSTEKIKHADARLSASQLKQLDELVNSTHVVSA